MIGPGEPLSRGPSSPIEDFALFPDQSGLVLNVQSTQDEGHLVAEAAQRVGTDLEPCPAAGAPCTPLTSTRSGPASVSWMVSNQAATSGPRYPGSPISYNSCAVTVSTVTAPPVPACLVMSADAVGSCRWAIGNPGTATVVGQFGEEGEVAAGRLSPRIRGCGRPRWPRPARRNRRATQPKWAMAGPTDQRGVGDPAGDHDVGSGAAGTAAIPSAPR